MFYCFIPLYNPLDRSLDLKLISAALKDTHTLSVFLIGFACDYGALNCDSRTGAEKAPDCIRDIMKTITIAHNKDIKLHDCGNIQINTLAESLPQE